MTNGTMEETVETVEQDVRQLPEDVKKYARVILPKLKAGINALALLVMTKKEVAMKYIVTGQLPESIGSTKDYSERMMKLVYFGHEHRVTGKDAEKYAVDIPAANNLVDTILAGLTEEEKASAKIKTDRDSFNYDPLVTLLKANPSITIEQVRAMWKMTDAQVEKLQSLLA